MLGTQVSTVYKTGDIPCSSAIVEFKLDNRSVRFCKLLLHLPQLFFRCIGSLDICPTDENGCYNINPCDYDHYPICIHIYSPHFNRSHNGRISSSLATIRFCSARGVDLCQYFGHKKLNFSPSITYAERIIS